MDVRQNKSVLWAYKKKLIGFTSHRKKRENKIKKEIQRGTREKNAEDPFELFVSLHNIRYVFYKESDKILGNTYGMVSLFFVSWLLLLALDVVSDFGGSASCKISRLSPPTSWRVRSRRLKVEASSCYCSAE
jgi:tRNA(Met) C34 N-acetyltransferase TmcA